MKLKNKGKVYPCSPEMEALKLLPAAILAIATLLSVEDREVLAYLISRSTTNPSSQKKSAHKAPRFECECFDCYTSYWFRWDSYPNRELINQAIEAFEDHLATGDKSKRTARGKRRDKNARRLEKLDEVPSSESIPVPASPEKSREEVSGEEVAASNDKGSDLLGSIKSRIWGLWNPNV